MNRFKDLVIIIIILLPPRALYSCPAPSKIKINETTFEEVESMYNVLLSQTSEDNYVYTQLNASDFQIEGLNKVFVVTNPQGIIENFNLRIDKSKFDQINALLASKYVLKSSKIANVGNKLVKYKDGECWIFLTALHMDFELELVYTTDNFRKKRVIEIKREQEQKRQSILDKF